MHRRSPRLRVGLVSTDCAAKTCATDRKTTLTERLSRLLSKRQHSPKTDGARECHAKAGTTAPLRKPQSARPRPCPPYRRPISFRIVSANGSCISKTTSPSKPSTTRPSRSSRTPNDSEPGWISAKKTNTSFNTCWLDRLPVRGLTMLLRGFWPGRLWEWQTFVTSSLLGGAEP
jgi:hypothetical protein